MVVVAGLKRVGVELSNVKTRVGKSCFEIERSLVDDGGWHHFFRRLGNAVVA